MHNPNKAKMRYSELTCSQPTNNPRPTNAGMNYGDNVTQFTLECRVKICAALDSSQAVAVCQFCEDADVAVVFELDTCFFPLI